MRKSTDYVAKSIAMAGGQYVAFDDSTEENAQSTVTVQMETFYAGAHDADVLIYNGIIDGELTTVEELLALEPLLGDFKDSRSEKQPEGRTAVKSRDLNGADAPLRFLTKLQ